MLTAPPQLETYGMTVVMAANAESHLLAEQLALRANAVHDLDFSQLFAPSDKFGAFAVRSSKKLKDEVGVPSDSDCSLAHVEAIATVLRLRKWRSSKKNEEASMAIFTSVNILSQGYDFTCSRISCMLLMPSNLGSLSPNSGFHLKYPEPSSLSSDLCTRSSMSSASSANNSFS